MNRFSRKSHPSHGTETEPGEDRAVRQYRYLLRTAPGDALEAAHGQGLGHLSDADRAELLRTAQDVLVTGMRLTPTHIAPLAHLMTRGERRIPGALVSAYPSQVLHALATQVIGSEAVFGLFGGYAGWDGADPSNDPGTDDSPYGQPWHATHDTPAIYRGLDGSQANPESFLGY